MVNHLNKFHGISEAQQGRALADQWRVTEKKQAWSCGFCVSLFINYQDRLKHIDTEHFKKYKNIKEWDFNKVIHGLLLQPRMEQAWKKRTASQLTWARPEDLVWAKTFAKDMRKKLEIGPINESEADELAKTVYSASKLKGSWHEVAVTPTSVIGNGTAGLSSVSSTNQHQVLATQAFDPSLQRPMAVYDAPHLFGDSQCGRPAMDAYDASSSVLPSMTSSGEGSRGGSNDPFSYPWI